MSVQNTEKKTPCVPTPDWSINLNDEMETGNEETVRKKKENTLQDDEEEGFSNNRVSVISRASNQMGHTNYGNSTNINHTPVHCGASSSSLATPAMPTSQSFIAGEVALTPTHSHFTPQAINPHSAMTAITPMVSGTDQAKNSIKVQNCVSTIHLGCELKLLDIYCRTRFSEYNPARFHGVVMKIIDPRATALVFRSGKVLCTGLRNEHDSYIAARKFARIIQKLGYPLGVFTRHYATNKQLHNMGLASDLTCKRSDLQDLWRCQRDLKRYILYSSIPITIRFRSLNGSHYELVVEPQCVIKAKFLDFKIQNFIATADLRFPIRLEALQQAHGQFASYEPELFPGLVYRMVRPRVVLLIFVNGKIVFTGGKTRGEINEALDIIYPILRSYRIS